MSVPKAILTPERIGAGEADLGIAGGLARLFRLRRRQRAAQAVGERGGGGEQGRHVIGAGLPVELEGVVVGEGAVLDRVDAGAERGVDAVDAVGVRGDLAAERSRGQDDGADLVVHHLLVEAAGDVAEHAAGRRDLDHFGAEADLFAHGAAAVVGAVAGVDRPLGGDPVQVAIDAVARDRHGRR